MEAVGHSPVSLPSLVWQHKIVRAPLVRRPGGRPGVDQIPCPPETSIRWALTQRLSSDSRLAIIGPISSGTLAGDVQCCITTKSPA